MWRSVYYEITISCTYMDTYLLPNENKASLNAYFELYVCVMYLHSDWLYKLTAGNLQREDFVFSNYIFILIKLF